MSVIKKIFNVLKWPQNYHDNDEIISYITDLKRSFEKIIENFQPNDKIFELVKSVLQDISTQNSTDYSLYTKIDDNKDLWQNLSENNKWYLKETNNITTNSDSLIFVKSFNKKQETSDYEIETEFIVTNPPKEDPFLIEMQSSDSDNLFYFKSELENFVKKYLQAREIHYLKEEKEKNELKFRESEKKVISANKDKRRKLYELHNLVEASNDIYSILDFKQLINSSLLTIIGQVGFQKAFVLLYDKKTKVFNQVYHKGFSGDKFEDLQFDLTSPIVPYLFKNRTPVYISRLEQNKKLKGFAKKLKKLGILVVAPMIFSERLQGIIGAGEKLQFQNFSETDFEIFHILVNIISISIGNSHMFQDIKTLSLTDAMTGLHNYRYFEDRLKEELNRAKRHNKNVSLMILDIDYFKNYNDTLGHQAGDEVLRMMGKFLKDTIRDEDIVARYGGEEFCIILPGIEKKGIPILGERVRKKIELEKFFKEEVQPGGKLTISIGTATFPDDAGNYSNLVEKADKALYQAKNAGRNQLKIFEENTIGA
jgi:diguanylate cyclase (GGDEF)-like protein